PAMWPTPKPRFKPAVWRYAAAREALHQAGEFVPVEQAERRNLIMVNPIEGNIYATSRNIVAAYQMVKSGEQARSHRHTAEALGPGNGAKTVEIAKGALPTIGLHLLRLPSGARREVAKTTVNHLYSVISGKARVTIEGNADQSLSVGDVITVPCWHAHSLEA